MSWRLILLLSITLPLIPAEAGAEPMHDAHNRFGLNLFNQIVERDFGENIFISPASATFALAMLYNGAAGDTRDEMTGLLELTGMSLKEINTAREKVSIAFVLEENIWNNIRQLQANLKDIKVSD